MFFLLAAAAASSLPSASPPSVAHYRIAATVYPARGSILVDTRIVLPRAEARSVTDLVLGDTYTIRSVDLPAGATSSIGPSAKPFPGLQQIHIRFGAAVAAPKVRIRYDGSLSPSGEPPLNMVTPNLTELNLDSKWVPFRDDLNLRFTVEATIRGLPGDATVVAQGSITRRNGTVQIVRTVPDIDFAFVAATGLKRAKKPGFELYAANLGSPAAEDYLKHGAGAISYLERWLGPMPGKPARLVVVRRTRDSGYARSGYIVLTEGATASEARRAKFTAHEFSHAWFSSANAMTADRWIDEAIAEYVAIRYVEATLGRDAGMDILRRKEAAAAKAGPVLTTGGDEEFYSKGPLRLAALESRIGRERLDRLIALVAQRRIGTTERFLETLAEVADPGSAAWFDGKLKD